jgi:pimeloyl-ACP methyl ester carboxylesterase
VNARLGLTPAIASIAVTVVLMGCTSNREAAPSSAQPRPTSATAGRVDVGGYQLAWRCRGQGSPTVVAEAGYDASGISAFSDLMGPLSGIAHVCTYDRAGIGLSDSRPDDVHVTSLSQANELHTLLQAANISPPYVFVAHSYGGFIARLFAATYRAETAGLVLVDSSHEDEIGPYRRYYGNSPVGDWVDGGDLIDIDATRHALRTVARDYGDMPLAVVKAGTYQDVLTTALWDRTQADLAGLSSNSVLMQAEGGHLVMDDDPKVFLAAVNAVVASARSGRLLPSCQKIVAGTDGRCPVATLRVERPSA